MPSVNLDDSVDSLYVRSGIYDIIGGVNACNTKYSNARSVVMYSKVACIVFCLDRYIQCLDRYIHIILQWM